MSSITKEEFMSEVEQLWLKLSLGESSIKFQTTDRSQVVELQSKKQKNNQSVSKLEIDIDDLSADRLSRCSVVEMKALCKSKGLKVSGKKDELYQRLLDYGKGSSDVSVKKPLQTKKKVSETSKALSAVSAKPISVTIRKNTFGNLEHPQTGLVFEEKHKTAIGVQEDSGSIRPLTDEDIETCKQWKFTFTAPNNLDESKMMGELTKKSGLSKIEKIIEDGREDKIEDELIDPEEEPSDVESEEELLED